MPGCGKTSVYWKKLCGNPICKLFKLKVTRDGLNINMESSDKNVSLV